MSTRPELAVGAVIVDDDEMVLVRRGHGPAGGLWSLPGGRVEHGETLVEAVVREVLEETNLEVVCGEFLGYAEIFAEPDHFVVLDFLAIALDPESLRAGDDAAEVKWVLLSDVAEMALTDGLAEFLADHDVIELFT